MRPSAHRPAACISPRPSVQHAAQRGIGGGGGVVELFDHLPTSLERYGLVIVDGVDGVAEVDRARHHVGGPIMVLAEPVDDERAVEALAASEVNHLASGEPSESDVRHLGDTSSKLRTGAIFGVERYLDQPAPIVAQTIATTDDKRRAVDELAGYGRALGMRRPQVMRLEAALDELLMNAMYDAPAAALTSPGAGVPARRTLASAATARWSHDDRYLAVSVTDLHGSLRKRELIASILRARRCAGQPRTDDGTVGAGLGVYLILAHCTRLVINLAPGARTEVICLFDRQGGGRPASRWARSIDIFFERDPSRSL